MKGFNPLEVPAYRFYNAAHAWLMDNMDEEQSLKFENLLRECDATPHPFHVKISADTVNRGLPKPTVRTYTEEEKAELPIEVVKKQEFTERGEHFKVPDWWRGEEAAYKISKNAMGGIASLPKMA